MISITKSLGAVICTSLNEGFLDTIKNKIKSTTLDNKEKQTAHGVIGDHKNAEKKILMLGYIKNLKRK